MNKISKGMGTVSQLTAVCIVLTFIVGMRWQDGFYTELGFPWMSGYSNYLDTIKAGIATIKLFLLAGAVGWFSIWGLSNWRYDAATMTLVLFVFILAPFGDLAASLVEQKSTPEYSIFKSQYQICTTGFILGGIIMLLSNKKTTPSFETEDSKFHTPIYSLLILCTVMIGIFDSPKSLGAAAAQSAVRTGFSNYSSVKDGKSEHWSIIGQNQGNFILARPHYKNNTIEIKVANNTSELIIYPATPISAGVIDATSTINNP
ncbi:hypothetical protein [Pseudomonas orientalis]|uniref:Uncharacterized protein n=1 Tax=Pseudomonas orientalis TaxID=76758 RepID=A0A4Q7D5K1_9PSED|nr:hypothetical protein [Pseudomonas orientalis]RZI33147.1 hypothetical protein EUX57_03905 [Pseudomonas orientalis]